MVIVSMTIELMITDASLQHRSVAARVERDAPSVNALQP
jgi:hypothetical protein